MAKIIERGGTAEHCPKCKINVLPVGTNGGIWRCPYCSKPTVPNG